MEKQPKTVVVWRPQPGPQKALITCPCDEVFFGGARGGGKTDGMLGKHAIKASKYGRKCVGVFFRPSVEDLSEAIERSHELYRPIKAEYNKQQRQWTFPDGARLKFRYVANDADALNYQGHNYTDLYFEEIQNWGDWAPINRLRATLRSPAGVPCQFNATGNPGGPGAHLVKARYIDPAPLGGRVLWEEFTDPFTGQKVRKSRVYIPSKLKDNRYLGSEYVANLYQSGSEALVRAWLTGDWGAIEGAFFDGFSPHKHVIRPFEVPSHWIKARAMDWGSAKPFCVLWFAVASEDFISPEGDGIPKGALVVYREWYGASGPNIGLKLTAEQVASGVLSREQRGETTYSVIDPAAYQEDGGPSIAERMWECGASFARADNSRAPGHDQVRQRLCGDADGFPMLYLFSTCTNLIRTLPLMQHDARKAEDMDTDGEDHAVDTLRYGCMSRPWTRPAPQSKEVKLDTSIPTIGQVTEAFLKRNKKRRRA